ncbi:MAG: hypothetical protein KatS3mg028_0052 [Bacteroidia bacterium]|nr:MAG: hypothetical protein KatS3mg028_0052 [Bacteroidia bacterium]
MELREHILNQIMRWCAYRDRSEQEAVEKLLELGVEEKEIAGIIEYLKEERYLDEKRFVQNFIQGKLSKKWGIEKIKHHLRYKYQVPEELINQCLLVIDREDYLIQLEKILRKKKELLEKKEKDKSILKKKIINFALSKGYDYSDIYRVINELKF